MFNFKNKKDRFCFFAMLISLAIMLIVFIATDGITGDKEFSEYTQEDWSIAILPLSIIVLSCISTLVFATIIMIPIFRNYPALVYYLENVKFSEIEPETNFLVFDHNELKRACCRIESQNGLWVSIQEYNLKTREWNILENGRYIDNADNLVYILQKDYGYDKAKYFYP